MVIYMKILVLTDEVWNDTLYPNNVLTNWLQGFPAVIANIYLAGGAPDNTCCQTYYQITDGMMIKSLFTKTTAGQTFRLPENKRQETLPSADSYPDDEGRVLTLIKNKLPMESLRLVREGIWLLGHYDITGLKDFVAGFQPDVIFSLRYASLKVLRFERLLLSLSKKPMFVFTGDDEYTLAQLSFSPCYWLRRTLIRKALKRNAEHYYKYYTLSEEQSSLYSKIFHIRTGVLSKCGSFETYKKKPVQKPLILVYAGRLYCHRYKTLLAIKEALKVINKNKVHMILNIYSRDKVSKKYLKLLDDNRNSYLHPPVSPAALKQIYYKADIALHVESFDIKNRLLTKYSFSTKIIDCLASSCAVLAICPKSHAGYDYLKKQDSAICVSSLHEIKGTLTKLCKKKSLVQEYQKKAWSCGQRNHQKYSIQQMLLEEMKKAGEFMS
ncbi:hypothetical protein acsn021_22500 [Anaerocolumna cellulosilytica]|uniref:Glycosyl transferase family 1 domain-containing protein n=2 Tax=Anaerocolumna cellulosilytica TaxID=433286 RepID=A0A6S6R6N9_9FIRM|nr:hypothetical protein acsn021_22500 [Anaerocolumna cellulosilytica]